MTIADIRAASSGSFVAGSVTNSIAHIAPRPRTSPIWGNRACIAREPVHHRLAGAHGRLQQPLALDLVEHRERGGGGHRVPAVGAAQPAHVHRVHQLGAAGDRADRHAAAERLRRQDDVGDARPRPRS